jgi:DNA-binding response OmpR family regulator
VSRILIVEDDPAVRDVVEYALSREGMATLAIKDGEAALDHLRGPDPFDLVILDVMLPGVDGISVCRELRAGATNRDVPVLMLTARDDETSVVVGLEVGADDYITKPFSPRELVAAARVPRAKARPPQAGGREPGGARLSDRQGIRGARLSGLPPRAGLQ